VLVREVHGLDVVLSKALAASRALAVPVISNVSIVAIDGEYDG
jgi:hypothetical protein